MGQRSQRLEAVLPDLSPISPEGGCLDAVAADAERFLRQINGGLSQPLGSEGWLQRTGLNIQKASAAQHLEAIALAYASQIRIYADPMCPAIMVELETLSGRKRSRATRDLHLIGERFVLYGARRRWSGWRSAS